MNGNDDPREPSAPASKALLEVVDLLRYVADGVNHIGWMTENCREGGVTLEQIREASAKLRVECEKKSSNIVAGIP